MPGERILVVEDNDVMREGLQLLIASEGYQVLGASNGLEAIQKMDSLTPDLILSDISMPEMDGYAFYEAVRARTDGVMVPFIFLTARSERDEIFASKKIGVEDFLVKPIDRQELITIIRSRLDRNQQLMLAQLEQAYEATLIMLANAIELRDNYTRGHVDRVMRYSILIARRLGWTNNQMKALQFGAILHDIGKIYVKENILLKAGPLDGEEWDEMQQHALVGSELLNNVSYLTDAIPIIRYHHERWDGNGYPDGLAGEEIPWGARIVAVTDSFDAMTTARVYHQASTPRQALYEIQAGSGSRYDPQVVEAFFEVWEQIEQQLSNGLSFKGG